MSTEYSSMTVGELKTMYHIFLARHKEERHALAQEMGIYLRYGAAEKEFTTDMKPETQAFILTHTECGGFGKDFNSAARTMLKGQEGTRKRLREQLDWRKSHPRATPLEGMPYKNLTDKSVLMLDLLWPCTIDRGKKYWEEECLRIRNMLGYINLRPAPAQPRGATPITQEDPAERATSTPARTTGALTAVPATAQTDTLAEPDAPEEDTMPPATTPPTPAPEDRNLVFLLVEQCDSNKELRTLVLALCNMPRADRIKLRAYLNAAPVDRT